MTRRANAASLILLVFVAGCSDDGTGPSKSEEPRSLRLEVPEFVADGQPFQLRVRAHGSDSSSPLAGFAGTAELTVSSGTISPQSVQLSGGVGQVDASLSGAAGEVTIRATLAGLESTALLQVSAPGKLLQGLPDDPAESAIPQLSFTARASDYSDTHPDLPGIFLSFNTLLLAFEAGTTVGEANAILGPLDAEIVGGIRGVAGQAAGILFLRLATTEHETMETALNGLQSRPEILAAAQDALLEPRVISADNGGSPGDWTWTSSPDGGNWGLELIRVPQMWNLNGAIDKSVPPSVRTGVLDAGFTAPGEHPDLKYLQHLSPTERHYHGAHVAGIIGATFNGGDDKTGIDGINPFARLVVMAPGVVISGETALTKGASWGQGFVYELDALLRAQPDLRVLNISMGYPWKPPGVNTSMNVVAQNLVRAHGVLHKTLLDLLKAEGHALPLIVTAAGNESENVAQEAKYGSPMNYAALELGVLNTIVVEALERSPGSPGGATRSSTSNHNGHLSAPGGEILSTFLPPTLYDTRSGTSMAAPHVAGLAGFLLAVDPHLTTAELWELLLTTTVPVAGGASPRVDAFTAVMDIDRLRGTSDVLRMLVDMDDGTADGNLRVDPDDESGGDHTEIDADEDGGIGDGDIDMSDFRRFRDGYLALAYGGIDGAIELDGSDTHPKKDLNGNGRTESEGDDESVYPFADLNGDNRTDDSAADVPVLGSVTDLQMLEYVFEDPHYARADLGGLLFSMDIAIRPGKLLDAGEAVDIHSSVRPADSDEADDAPKFRRVHTGNDFAGEGLWQVYTVPAYEDGGLTERTYTVRVIALDAGGDTIADLERDFTGKPGQDHFWDPGCEVHEGQLTLRTQTDVNAAAGICEVTGALVVEETTGTPDPVKSLLPLAQLERAAELSVSNTSQLVDLTGLGRLALKAQSSGFDIRSNQALISLNGLAADEPGVVQSVGFVQIIANPLLTNVAGASNLIGSGSIAVDYRVQISANPLLATLDGLGAIRTVHDAVAIVNNPALTSLAALSKLEEVGGKITIERNGLTAIDFPVLKRIRGDIDIMNNNQLTRVALVIDSVGKELSNGIRVADNNALTSLSIDISKGVPELRADALPALTTLDVRVGSGRAEMVAITRTGLTTITRYDVKHVVDEPGSMTDGFYVYENPNLTDIGALRNLESVATYFMLRNNPALCVPEWVSGVKVGTRVIRDNKDPSSCE